MGCRESQRGGEGAYLGFSIIAQGQNEPGKLRPGDAIEHIALVVFRHPHIQAAIVYPGVVPGGDEGGPDPVGVLRQITEFHGRVAQNAGVRGLAPGVCLGKGPADLLLQVGAGIGDLQGNRHGFGGCAHLISRGGAAGFQIKAVYVIAPLPED